MKIGIIGGTGGMGEGFALRWCVNHDILLGSRDRQKAQLVAENHINNINNNSFSKKITGSIKGDDNLSVAKESDILILSIPYENIESTCKDIGNIIKDSCIVVSPIVPMSRNQDGFYYIPFVDGKKSAGVLVAENLPNCNKVISAFHTISEVKLKNIKDSLNADTFICTDNKESLQILNNLIAEIEGLRSVYLGPLSLSYQAEVMTPMILNASKQNKLKHPGIKLV
ncbi:NADPH-dependent F420 reductase [Candidatus Nitrosocosmicus franklandus]|uniref:Prephenate dehydrogenase n=1 Tax=Candidatus Nitrosocosmicus franklandianus TaxID=1798806 RepID=A0A484IEI0_9ARCH|nr:NADPH-dependent F420 reductase [Candidatus Nitrosocosmicus franklandus]VFJ14549.1 Prephenate dehydrogenase [Candidatus Nitrosocosmicus franklandus]